MILLSALLLLGPLARAAECEDWGQIRPTDKVVFVGESAEFYILGGSDPDCGDSDACAWSVDDDLGSLSSSSGDTVTWTAPATLADCLPIDLRIYAECPAVAPGQATITLQCTDEALGALRASPDSSVAGGGCGTPTSAAGVLLLPLILRSRRRFPWPKRRYEG